MTIQGPFSASTNNVYDGEGTKDSRPFTWGDAAYQDKDMQFYPPTGYRVRVLRVYGDFTGWIHGAPAPHTAAGTMFALAATDFAASERLKPAADGCFLYVLGAIAADGPQVFRSPFDFDVSNGGLLAVDNKMLLRLAVFLNELGVPVHMECTFVVEYQFEL